MTAIAAAIGEAAARENEVSAMLTAMRTRGGDDPRVWSNAPAALGAAAHAWEGFGSAVLPLAVDGEVTVVADATLYYRADLCTRIGGSRSDMTRGAASLILAAYRRFGDDVAQHLEGDFAFVLWDGARRQLLAARDFVGKRTLYWTHAHGLVVLASTLDGITAHSRVSPALNVGAIGAAVAGLWVNTAETCYAGVNELRAGMTLISGSDRAPVVRRTWHAPVAIERDGRTVQESAAELRTLLIDAVHERLAPSGPTAVTLSGGWDSTAVFGAGQEALRARGDRTRSIVGVSMSYPPGDPGREDELIAQVNEFWQTQPRWIDIASVEMFSDADRHARERDEPSAHPYQAWHRALARGALEAGARVVLDGSGGDQLFNVSEVFLADLVRTGQWITAMREWRARGRRGFREFLSAAVRPALSERTLAWLARIRGTGRPRHYLERAPSNWMRPEFLRTHRVLESELENRPELPTNSAIIAETTAYLVYPYFPRVTGRVFGFALSEGVEFRSPLLDARVVRYAASRPWYERTRGNETKVLLRRAMEGLLPDGILAPRAHRTGVTSGYFGRSLSGPGRPIVEALMKNSTLESLGMIDSTILGRAWEYFLATGNDDVGSRIFFTIQTELWLREHRGLIA